MYIQKVQTKEVKKAACKCSTKISFCLCFRLRSSSLPCHCLLDSSNVTRQNKFYLYFHHHTYNSASCFYLYLLHTSKDAKEKITFFGTGGGLCDHCLVSEFFEAEKHGAVCASKYDSYHTTTS